MWSCLQEGPAVHSGHAKLCRQGVRGRQGGQQLYSFAVTGIDRVIKVVSTYCATARQDRALDITNANEANTINLWP